ncbi:MAG: aspartate/glutamate racemase family protein [Syntrophomonadaceae bacterium]|nr:aspartate/glutamate racemase family protein [Syntrophomonadaceae bacterium]MDD4550002.1 aspartate/glutamate racemase family protein [Syntrophomonadaceae bacterium]
MRFQAQKGRGGYGQAIGILMLEDVEPFIPGDVANATTYEFPVRFKVVEGLTFERIKKKDLSVIEPLLQAGKELVTEGVRAITGDCGFMALFQRELANALEVPVFLSSLLQVPFISMTLREGEKIGVITADSLNLDRDFLAAVGIDESISLHIVGLQDQENFSLMGTKGYVNSEKVEEEVVAVAKTMVKEDPLVKAILLECSMLPPYGAAVQEAVSLPVYDYITMINYIFSAVVKKKFNGFM